MNTKIFIVYHKPHNLISSSIYTPICVGDKKDSFPLNVFRDDKGDNIADKNNQYNELTAIYWVYKHLDEFKDTEYIGFAHYRRLFCFNDFSHTVFVQKKINYNLIEINEERINEYFKQYDLLIPYPNYRTSVYKQYVHNHGKHDIIALLKIIKRDYPEYYSSATKYFHNYKNNLYNIFIMKRDDFISYCNLMFSLCDTFIKETSYRDRLFLSERITGIFIQHMYDTGKNALHLPLLLINEKNFVNSFRQVAYNFKTKKNYSFSYKLKPLWLYFMPRKIEEKLRRKKHAKAL